MKRLLVEETPALFEAFRQTREPGGPVKVFGTAVESDGKRRARLCVRLQDQLAHQDG